MTASFRLPETGSQQFLRAQHPDGVTYWTFGKFTGNIYLNINRQGYLNMDAGQTYELNVLRNWQAIESFMNSQIALPDAHYRVLSLDGGDSDVVTITPMPTTPAWPP